MDEKEERCHDCNARAGDYHMPGCDVEECPFCHEQLISCNCCYEIMHIDPDKEPTYSNGLNDEQEEMWDKILRDRGLIPFGSETRFV